MISAHARLREAASSGSAATAARSTRDAGGVAADSAFGVTDGVRGASLGVVGDVAATSLLAGGEGAASFGVAGAGGVDSFDVAGAVRAASFDTAAVLRSFAVVSDGAPASAFGVAEPAEAVCVSDFDVSEATSDGWTRLGGAVRGARWETALRAVRRTGDGRSRTTDGSVDDRGSGVTCGSGVGADGRSGAAGCRSSAGDARGSDGGAGAEGAVTLAVGDPGPLLDAVQ
jgi:hypothetical protein